MDTGSVTLAANTRVKRDERDSRQEHFSAKVLFRLRGDDTVLALSLSIANLLADSHRTPSPPLRAGRSRLFRNGLFPVGSRCGSHPRASEI